MDLLFDEDYIALPACGFDSRMKTWYIEQPAVRSTLTPHSPLRCTSVVLVQVASVGLHPHCALEAVWGRRCQPTVTACLMTPTSSAVFAVFFIARQKSITLGYTGVWKIYQGIGNF